MRLVLLLGIQTRLKFVSWLRVLISSVNMGLMVTGSCMRVSPDEPVLLPVVFRASTGPLVLACLGLRLPIKKNIAVQGLGTIVSLVCLPHLSMTCGTDPLVVAALEKVKQTDLRMDAACDAPGFVIVFIHDSLIGLTSFCAAQGWGKN